MQHLRAILYTRHHLGWFSQGQGFHYVPEELLFIPYGDCGSRHMPLGLFLCVCKMLHKNMKLYTQYRSLNFEYKSVFSHINFREIYCFVNSKNGVCAFSS